MNFINERHEKRFNELTKNIGLTDRERRVAMYILSGNSDLYNNVDSIYDFEDGYFKMDLAEDEKGNTIIKWKIPFSSSEKALVTLAFDLFSGNSTIGVYDVFRSLDIQNRELALSALRYAFIR